MTSSSNIEFGEGSYAEYRDQIDSMLQDNWEELGMAGGPKELNVDTAWYDYIHHIKSGRTYGVAENGKLIGYASFFVGPHPHHKNKIFATSCCFYIRKDKRKGLLGYRFIKHCEKKLKEAGVDYVQLVMNSNFPIDRFLGKLKYTLSDKIYIREI